MQREECWARSRVRPLPENAVACDRSQRGVTISIKRHAARPPANACCECHKFLGPSLLIVRRHASTSTMVLPLRASHNERTSLSVEPSGFLQIFSNSDDRSLSNVKGKLFISVQVYKVNAMARSAYPFFSSVSATPSPAHPTTFPHNVPAPNPGILETSGGSGGC